ncbi:DUF397 domain-containing protein [Streptomyces griseosporeus]|uniref:DUF397 domain-containing protein n=1 Tax=Streptomyces griseosporeus TaxID=1910 RepID=UPI003701CE99
MSADLNWFKSSYSGSQGGECLEIAPTPHTIHIRDSKSPTTPHLTLSPATWTTFLGSPLLRVHSTSLAE